LESRKSTHAGAPWDRDSTAGTQEHLKWLNTSDVEGGMRALEAKKPIDSEINVKALAR